MKKFLARIMAAIMAMIVKKLAASETVGKVIAMIIENTGIDITGKDHGMYSKVTFHTGTPFEIRIVDAILKYKGINIATYGVLQPKGGDYSTGEISGHENVRWINIRKSFG